MASDEELLRRIDELLAGEHTNIPHVGEVQLAATTICSLLYGPDSPQVRSIATSRSEIWAAKIDEFAKFTFLGAQLFGLLRGVASDIRAGRTRSLRLQSAGEVFGDFLSSAKSAASDGHFSVAAVLACCALEDALKRYAAEQGLQVYDKEMSEVINALKSAGRVRGPQGSLLSSFVKIRNKAFHAQWDAIDPADVQGVIGFTQEFLLQNFSPNI